VHSDESPLAVGTAVTLEEECKYWILYC